MARRQPKEQQLATLLREADAMLIEVKNEYELYFLGRIPAAPVRKMQVLQRKVRELDRHFTSNTQLKFQRTSLRSRFGTLSGYWQRSLVQIESGTYRRHQVRADRHDSERAMKDIARKRAEKRAEKEATAPPPDKSRTFREENPEVASYYLELRKQLGEASEGLNEEKVAAKLNAHARAIRAKTGCKKVAFRIRVEKGKSKVMAVPLKK